VYEEKGKGGFYHLASDQQIEKGLKVAIEPHVRELLEEDKVALKTAIVGAGIDSETLFAPAGPAFERSTDQSEVQVPSSVPRGHVATNTSSGLARR